MAQVINIREYPLSTSLYLYYQYTRPNGVIVVNTPTGSYDLDTVNATLTQTYQGSSNTTKNCYIGNDVYTYVLSDYTTVSRKPTITAVITKNGVAVSNTVTFSFSGSFSGFTATSYSVLVNSFSIYNGHIYFSPFISMYGRSTGYSSIQYSASVLLDYNIETNELVYRSVTSPYTLNGLSVESKISLGNDSASNQINGNTTKTVSIIYKSTPTGAVSTNMSNYGTQTRTISDIMTKPNTSFYRDGILYAIIDTHLFTLDVNSNLVVDTGTIINIPNFQSVIKVNDNQFLILGETSYIVEWVEYDFTYTINSNDGKEIYLTLEGQSPITKVRFNYTEGNNVGYVFNTLSGVVSGRIEIEIPEGKSLLGFSSTPNSTRAPYPINTDVEVGIYENYNFYAVFLTYRPPVTTFDVNLYQNFAEVMRVDKEQFLVGVDTLSGALREGCSILNPVIIFQSESVPSFNYVYISIFNRYYYVTNIVSVRKNLWEVSMSCDVLMSYKDGILSLTTTVSRNENAFNYFINDSRALTECTKDIEILFGTQGQETTIWETPTVFSLDSYGDGSNWTPRYRYVLTSAVKSGTITPPTGGTPMWTTFQSNYKWLLSEEELSHIMNEINGTSLSDITNIFSNNPIESIIHLKAYPFNFYHLNGDTWNRTSNVMLGNYIIAGTANTFVFDEYATEHNELTILNFYIPKDVTTWRDYSATYSLFLPFYGFINISADEIIGKYVSVRYTIDFNTGLCLAKLGYSTTSDFIDFTEFMRFSFNIGIDLPISASNGQEVMRGILQTGLLLVGAASFGVSSVISVPEATETSTALTTVGSSPNLPSAGFSATGFDGATGATITKEPYANIGKRDFASITSRATDKIVNHIYRGANGGNPAYDIRSTGSPFIIKMKSDYIYPTNYAKEQGFPLYETRTLSTLSGYTECIDVKITGVDFATALHNEVVEIKHFLETGVILPVISS